MYASVAGDAVEALFVAVFLGVGVEAASGPVACFDCAVVSYYAVVLFAVLLQ